MSAFSKFYYLTELSERCGLKLPDGVHANIYGYGKHVSYRSDNIRICVEKDDGFAPLIITYETSIFVDKGHESILVYKDWWVHSVPKEMKELVKLHIWKIKNIVKYYKSIKVENSYYSMIKRKKAEEKNKKIQAHEEEKKKLIEMFKGK